MTAVNTRDFSHEMRGGFKENKKQKVKLLKTSWIRLAIIGIRGN